MEENEDLRRPIGSIVFEDNPLSAAKMRLRKIPDEFKTSMLYQIIYRHAMCPCERVYFNPENQIIISSVIGSGNNNLYLRYWLSFRIDELSYQMKGSFIP